MSIRIIIGGYAQGKLDYALQKHCLPKHAVWDGRLPDILLPEGNAIIINHFHDWVKKQIAQGRCPERETLGFLEHYKECTIICDEVGNGIVPMEAAEREYRERLGKILIMLAERADIVERVICGIGQRIK